MSQRAVIALVAVVACSSPGEPPAQEEEGYLYPREVYRCRRAGSWSIGDTRPMQEKLAGQRAAASACYEALSTEDRTIELRDSPPNRGVAERLISDEKGIAADLIEDGRGWMKVRVNGRVYYVDQLEVAFVGTFYR